MEQDSSTGRRSYRKRKVNVSIPEAPRPRVINKSMLQFLFEKKLSKTDVSTQNSIIIPTGYAKQYFPESASQNLTYFVDDLDTQKVWTFSMRTWPNNGTRKYVIEGTARYVEKHDLRQGDYIMMYKDDEVNRYVIGFRKEVKSSDDIPSAGEKNVYLPIQSPKLAISDDHYSPHFGPDQNGTYESITDKVDPEYVEKNFKMSWDDFLDFNPFTLLQNKKE